MRAWLLVIAVLATFQPIVQVASTEDLSSSSSVTSTQTSTTDNNKNQLNRVNNDEEVTTTTTTTTTTTRRIESSSQQRTKPDPETQVQIEQNLLSLFGMKTRPRSIDRSKVVIPEAMKQLYAEITGQELRTTNLPKPGLHTKSANTVRSFQHEESKIDDRFLHHHRFRLYFNVSGIPKNEQLKAAELTLNRSPVLDGTRLRHKVLVFDIVQPGTKGKTKPIFLLVDTKTVHVNGSESIQLDVTPAVDRWLRTPKQNFGILVEVVSGIENLPAAHQHIRLKRNVEEKQHDWVHKQPMLFTYTDDGRYKPRSIREVLNNRPRRRHFKRRDGRELCQRKPLYVDFSDVGWSEWIVAPPGYEAYYCHGECQFPFADHMNTTNHAVVQSLVNSINVSLAPKPCCVPTQLNPVTMLYLDEQNKAVLKNYQDMSVVGCGCR